MAQDHHKSGGSGRYYKDDSSRRSRKYFNQPHGFNSYSSYASNPNPFPPTSTTSHSPNLVPQESSGRSNSKPFSRRNEAAPGYIHNQNGNGWYQQNSSSSSGYRSSRPSSGQSMNKLPPSSKDHHDASRNQGYRDYDYQESYSSNKYGSNTNNFTPERHYDQRKEANPRDSISASSYDKNKTKPVVVKEEQDNTVFSINDTNSAAESFIGHQSSEDAAYTPDVTSQKENVPDTPVDSQIIHVDTNTNNDSKLLDAEQLATHSENLHKLVTTDLISTDDQSTSFLKKELDNETEKPMDVLNNEVEPIDAKEESIKDLEGIPTDVYSTIEGCIFPMKKIEYRLWELKHHSQTKRRQNLRYLNERRLQSLSEYTFYNDSFLVFKQADAYILHNVIKKLTQNLAVKKNKLTEEYIYRKHLWKANCAFYDEQFEKLYENESSVKETSVAAAVVEDPPSSKPSTSSSRRSRHHGDSVRTEAEFLEILASLEKEREKDPLIKAQFGAAIIPDMILDPIEKYAMTRKIDSNNLVSNKDLFADRLAVDGEDNFTESEHAKFCELYTLYPKRFGRISVEMGTLRTSEECVLHYYRTKKTTNYKQLLLNKNKRPKRKVAKKRKDLKGKPDSTISDTSNVELEVAEETDVPSEVIETSNILAPKRRNSLVEPLAQKQRKVSENVVVDNVEHINSVTTVVENHIKPEILEHNQHVEPVLPVNDSHVPETEEMRKAKKLKKPDEKHISSYWSVQDITSFPLLLRTFGTDWEKISEGLGTKSSTMVKNYFQRGLIDHPEWQQFSNHRAVGEGGMNVISMNQPPHIPEVPLGGPSLGYFYKPSSATSYIQPPTFNAMPPIMSTFTQPPTHSHPHPHPQPHPHLNHMGQPMPFYNPPVATTYNRPQLSTNPLSNIQPPLQTHISKISPPPMHPISTMGNINNRGNMMEMPSILNTPPMNLPHVPASVPTLGAGYSSNMNVSDHSVTKHPNIMSLLNADEAPEHRVEISQQVPIQRSSFKPNIVNIMNTPPSKPHEKVDGPHDHASNGDGPSQFVGGTSALDALARIAFERK